MQATGPEFIVRSFSLPTDLSEQLNEEAKREKRNVSNMLQVILAEHFARLDEEAEASAIGAAIERQAALRAETTQSKP